jgi:hypothetical protein
MGGPIVRTGPTPKFSDNWDRIFGTAPSRRGAGESQRSASKKTAAAKKKAAKKSPKKSDKKKR